MAVRLPGSSSHHFGRNLTCLLWFGPRFYFFGADRPRTNEVPQRHFRPKFFCVVGGFVRCTHRPKRGRMPPLPVFAAGPRAGALGGYLNSRPNPEAVRGPKLRLKPGSHVRFLAQAARSRSDIRPRARQLSGGLSCRPPSQRGRCGTTIFPPTPIAGVERRSLLPARWVAGTRRWLFAHAQTPKGPPRPKANHAFRSQGCVPKTSWLIAAQRCGAVNCLAGAVASPSLRELQIVSTHRRMGISGRRLPPSSMEERDRDEGLSHSRNWDRSPRSRAAKLRHLDRQDLRPARAYREWWANGPRFSVANGGNLASSA